MNCGLKSCRNVKYHDGIRSRDWRDHGLLSLLKQSLVITFLLPFHHSINFQVASLGLPNDALWVLMFMPPKLPDFSVFNFSVS
jgi:hypothetical protein